MNLLSAVRELERHAGDRRGSIKYLMTASEELIKAMLRQLREGDYVVVDGRTYIVEMRGEVKVLTVNHGVLGQRRAETGFTYASLEDNAIFAAHAEEVVQAFCGELASQRSWLHEATQHLVHTTARFLGLGERLRRNRYEDGKDHAR